MAQTCDICGKDDDVGGELENTPLLPAGDMMVCPSCLLGFGEDHRVRCPRCHSLVPVSYSVAMLEQEDLFIEHCFCGARWDETLEGDSAPIWQLLLRLKPYISTENGG